jgi:hypothetical protein
MSRVSFTHTRDARVRTVKVCGTVWSVFEVAPDRDTSSSPALVFECDGSAYRIREFPVAWYGLPDEDLFALRYHR